MRHIKFVLLTTVGALFLSGCSTSPMYSDAPEGVTPGTIPRDETGEPVWSRIPPPPPAADIP